MRIAKMVALAVALAMLLAAAARAQAGPLGAAELRRAELFDLVDGEDPDPGRAITPREGLGIVANALALSLGARDASFDNLAGAAPQEGAFKIRELCMALSRAGSRMGVPPRSDLEVPAPFTGAIGRSSFFATRDAPYHAPNGKTYENELLYAVAFACGTQSMTTDLTLIDGAATTDLEAPATWAQTVAAVLRLYEAVPPVGQAGPQDPIPQSPSPLPQTPQPAKGQATPTAEPAAPAKIVWIEVTAPLVNIRAGASLEDEVLSQASQGERYRTFGLTAEGWYIVEYEEGGLGYMSAQYCKQVEHGQVDQGAVIGTVTVLTTSSFVRAQPANSGAPVYTAVKGQSFECLGQEGNGWYKIRYGDGQTGYIYHKNCALSWFS